MARTEVSHGVQMFDFDSSTGMVSHPLRLLDLQNKENAYGVEFSPNSKIVYVTVQRLPIIENNIFVYRRSSIFQFNLYAGSFDAIVNSKTEIVSLSPSFTLGQMQLAKDGKIYIARFNQKSIATIDSPNTLGTECSFREDAVFLESGISEIGLPSFVSSLFLSFEADDVCLGEAISFSVDLTQPYDSLLWDFKDGTTSTTINPTHTYTTAGDYMVEFTTTLGAGVCKRYKKVLVYEQPVAHKPKDILLFNNNGYYTFDLSLQDETILNGQDENAFDVIYYANIENYNDNLPITDIIAYKNMVAYGQETIIASVLNIMDNDCTDFTSFNIQVKDRFPNYFTPNNDGIHDYWKVESIEEEPYIISTVMIYDRFGKMVANLDSASKGWDGNFNGKRLPETDYWFSVVLVNKEDANVHEEWWGHFSLIRR